MTGKESGGGVLEGAAERGSVGALTPVDQRPRERLLRLGAHALTDPELLAILFGTGTRANPVLDLAESLVATGGGLKALAQSDPHELCALPGLGPARAAQVMAALELGRRAQMAGEKRPRLSTPEQIFRYAWPNLCGLGREVFHVLCLNSRNVLLRDVRTAEGTFDFCHVDPREVFRAALTARAAAVVLVHNHPSGDATPSGPDLNLTARLVEGANVLGLRILDHVIVGDRTYHSLLEHGQMPKEGDASAQWAAQDSRQLRAPKGRARRKR